MRVAIADIPGNHRAADPAWSREDGSRPMPDAARLMIEQHGNAYFIIGLDSLGRFLFDVWHPSLSAAYEYALTEYAVPLEDWKQTDAGHQGSE